MDLNNREDRYYIKMAGRIECELGVAYTGRTKKDLKAFVDEHIDRLDVKKEFKGRWKEKKPKKKTSPVRSRPVLAPAPYKQSGMFRKHGQDGKFQSENT